jgi:hypothetical protein
VVSDVTVDDEAPVVTSRISRFIGAQSFGGAHRGRVCVRVFIGVSMCACCERLRCTVWILKKSPTALASLSMSRIPNPPNSCGVHTIGQLKQCPHSLFLVPSPSIRSSFAISLSALPCILEKSWEGTLLTSISLPARDSNFPFYVGWLCSPFLSTVDFSHNILLFIGTPISMWVTKRTEIQNTNRKMETTTGKLITEGNNC